MGDGREEPEVVLGEQVHLRGEQSAEEEGVTPTPREFRPAFGASKEIPS